jgi:hypothetical protein
VTSLNEQNTQVSETKEFSSSLCWASTDASTMRATLSCYRGSLDNPNWTDVEPGTHPTHHFKFGSPEKVEEFTSLCTLIVDISGVPKVPVKNVNTGRTYYEIRCDVVMNFELEAQLRWWERVSAFFSGMMIAINLAVGLGASVCAYAALSHVSF